MRQVLQSVTAFFITKCDGLLFQSATAFLLQSATGITKCNDYFKVRQYRATGFSLQLKIGWRGILELPGLFLPQNENL